MPINCGTRGSGALNSTQFETAKTNLTTILARIHLTGNHAPIVGMSYYDPFLGDVYYGNPTLAMQTQDAVVTFDAGLAGVYLAAAVNVADVASAFDLTNTAPTGSYQSATYPQNVANA